MSTELVKPDAPALLRPIANPAAILSAQAETTALITQALKVDVDYGVIPGTSKKASLFKAGAERLNAAFGVYPDYEVAEQEVDHNREIVWIKRSKKWNNATRDDKTFTWVEERGESIGLYRYVVKCILRLRCNDSIIGTGIGTCSTVESKYIDRPRDCENTVMKMAEKRAMVAAALSAYALSDRFTQDVEDLAGTVEVSTETSTPKEKGCKKAEPAAAQAATTTAAPATGTISPEGQRLQILLPLEADRRTFRQALHAIEVDWKAFVNVGPATETPEEFKERTALLLGAMSKPEMPAEPAPAADPAAPVDAEHADSCPCEDCVTKRHNAALDREIVAKQAAEDAKKGGKK